MRLSLQISRLPQRASLYGFVGLLALTGSQFQPTVVVGDSMAPTISAGKLLWTDRLYFSTHQPREGDVVVFRHAGNTYIKRVYGEPGSTVYLFSSGTDWIAPVRRSAVPSLRRRLTTGSAVYKIRRIQVPEDSVFLLGDNLSNSEDSRSFGCVPVSALCGRARMSADPHLARMNDMDPGQRQHPSQRSKPTPAQPVAHSRVPGQA